MGQLRIAVVGAGLMGRRHIDLIERSSACRLAAIVDPSPAAAELARAAAVPYFEALEAMLAEARPEGVILATPNPMHAAQALLCIEAAVPALIEKPVTVTIEEGRQLMAAAEAAKVKLLVGHHRQHSPIVAKAREIVDSGILGRMVAVTGSALFYKPEDYFAEGPWRSQPGGGPILINMIHEIGNLRALLGEITAVQALASSQVRGFAVEDTVAINLHFAAGALGSFILSDTAASALSWEQTAQENPRYASYDDVDCYTLVGTDGSLGIPTMRLKTYRSPAERSWWKPFETQTVLREQADPFERQLTHFCAMLRGEAEPAVTVNDGLQNLAVTEAIAQAAATGEVVTID